MKIILIDDEPLILEELSYLCEKHKDIEICGKFVNPKQALQYVAGHPVDFAFCDIRMPGITGLELLDQMHKEKPDLQAAFVTAYDQYAFDAYRPRGGASGGLRLSAEAVWTGRGGPCTG